MGNHQLSEDDRAAIVVAATAASENDFGFSLDAGHPIAFSHTADNGSGINGIEMYSSNFKC